MKSQKLRLWYDQESDTLELYFNKVREGHFKELKNKCFARIDKKTGSVVGYSIFNFSKRKKKFVDIEFPLPQKMLA